MRRSGNVAGPPRTWAVSRTDMKQPQLFPAELKSEQREKITVFVKQEAQQNLLESDDDRRGGT